MTTLAEVLAAHQAWVDSAGDAGDRLFTDSLMAVQPPPYGNLLAGRDLTGASLSETDFTDADLSGTDFFRAQLDGCVLTNAHCVGADFGKAEMWDTVSQHTDFSRTRFAGAKVRSAAWRSAVFANADLRQVSISRSDLTSAHLHGASFERTNFGGTDLTGIDASGAHGTIWPPRVSHPSWGGDLVEFLRSRGADVTYYNKETS